MLTCRMQGTVVCLPAGCRVLLYAYLQDAGYCCMLTYRVEGTVVCLPAGWRVLLYANLQGGGHLLLYVAYLQELGLG